MLRPRSCAQPGSIARPGSTEVRVLARRSCALDAGGAPARHPRLIVASRRRTKDGSCRVCASPEAALFSCCGLRRARPLLRSGDARPRRRRRLLAGADGMHISTGAIIAPDGTTWVSDHNAGFCRVSAPTDTDLGHIEHPQRPGDGGPRTCLGGLLPDAGPAPTPPASPPSSTRRPSSPGPVTSSRSSPTAPRPARRSSGRAGTATRTLHVPGHDHDRRAPHPPDRGQHRPGRQRLRRLPARGRRPADHRRRLPVAAVRIVATTTDGRAASRRAAGRDAQGHVASTSPSRRAALSVVTPAGHAGRPTPLGVTVPGASARSPTTSARPALRRHRERRPRPTPASTPCTAST